MDENQKKEGVSVKEIEQFAKKYKIEVFFGLSFIIACLFSFVFFGTGLAIIFATVGGVLGTIFPVKVEAITKKAFHFVFKQEPTTQLILGIVKLIISIFLPPLIFLSLGLQGGVGINYILSGMGQTKV